MDAGNFLFCALDAALVADLARQVHREGHDVKCYVEAESDREIGDGFVPKTDDWRAEVEGVEIAVCGFFDGTEFIDEVNFNFEHKRLLPVGAKRGSQREYVTCRGRRPQQVATPL